MSNDWNAFRTRLEADGYLYADEQAKKIPRVAEENTLRWRHLQRLMKMIQKKDTQFWANGEVDAEDILAKLLFLIKMENI